MSSWPTTFSVIDFVWWYWLLSLENMRQSKYNLTGYRFSSEWLESFFYFIMVNTKRYDVRNFFTNPPDATLHNHCLNGKGTTFSTSKGRISLIVFLNWGGSRINKLSIAMLIRKFDSSGEKALNKTNYIYSYSSDCFSGRNDLRRLMS